MAPLQLAVLLLHAVVGWAACGTVMGLSLARTTEQRAIVLHAVGVVPIYALLSGAYFAWFGYTGPVVTATVFVLIVLLLDYLVVARIILGNTAMFRSFSGVWLPLILIALVTFVVGTVSA